MIEGTLATRIAVALGWGRQAEWVRRHGRGLAWTWIAGYVLAVVMPFVIPQKKTISIVVQPAAASTLGAAAGSLASIAAKFGVDAGATVSTPLDFFSLVLQSDTMMREIVSQRFVGNSLAANSKVGAQLAEWWRHPWSDDGTLVARAATKLNKILDVSSDVPSGTMTVALESRTPELFQSVGLTLVDRANRVLEKVNRQSHRYERVYLEGQKATARAALYAVEDSLNRFYETNRSFASSPRLKLDEARLNTHIQLAQQVYSDLALRAAQAQQDEARDTPQLLVLDPGTIPPDRGPIKALALAVLTGFAFSFGWASWLLAKNYVVAYSPRPSSEASPK